MSTEIYKHTSLGDIKVRRSVKAGRLSITVRMEEVFVTVPRGGTLREAIAFVDSKKDWIEKVLKRNKGKIKPSGPILPPFSTKSHTLGIECFTGGNITVNIKDGLIAVGLPVAVDTRSDEAQSAIKAGVEEAYRLEAKAYLPGRVELLAKTYGFRYRSVTVRKSVTRWGSCSADDSISLSAFLMKLPYELIDYVILHELCHTVHKNHAYGFHELLDKVTAGNHLQLRSRLKGYSTRW